MLWQAVIQGETASKANSRKLVTFRTKSGGTRPGFIKSEKARSWADGAVLAMQAKRPAEPFTGRLGIDCHIFYATERPDLDASLVFDCLQKAGVIKNDRSLREQHLFHRIDKHNPRVEIVLFRPKEIA